ncbi:PAS domain S-box protein [Nostoc sphaeroides CCNUC1]|uniref:PAS domain S-box protein n=1 Tax=Nostoc sphaeroides CCNUC1 TaxID=2653204 RepID=A0A5P8VTV8_9NOSO|nr:PAS domain S-box protein [Nostoc sphaeroides CCNUC1]
MFDLELYVQQTGGSVEIGELPTIEADPLQMRQLLQNIIGNALKFHLLSKFIVNF